VNISTFLKASAALTVLYGLGFLLVPDFMATSYGLTPNPTAALTARYLGLNMIGFAVAGWLVSEYADWGSMRGVAIGIGIISLIGLIVSLVYTVNGMFSGAGWSAVVIYAVFLIGAIYFAFIQHHERPRAAH
jgi:hypothetical protein